MGDDNNRKSTDVDGSIAGYFFQILLGINSLTSLTNDEEAVGIECGADVRIITKMKNFISIEAKLHKDRMYRYSNDIVKTVYNFYFSNSNDLELHFVTNVGLTRDEDIKFFNGWGASTNIDEMVAYVKSCILRYCVKSKSKSEEKYAKKFSSYIKDKGEGIKDYITELEKDIDGGDESYSEYAYVDSKVNYEEFCKKIKFQFNSKLKGEAISDVEDSIKNNLRMNYNQLVEKLENNDPNAIYRIIELLMYRYLLSTKTNSEIGIDNSDIIKKRKIYVKELKDILENYNDGQIKLHKNIKLIEIKREFSQCECEFLESIDEYGDLYKDRLKGIYFNIRNQFFNISDIESYRKFIDRYVMGIDDYNIASSTIKISQLLFFLTMIELYNQDSKGSSAEIECALLDKQTVNNLVNNGEEICYKSSVNNVQYDFQRFFAKFIRNTYNSHDLYKTKIVIAGETFGKCKPCTYTDGALRNKVNIVINQANIEDADKLEAIYSDIDFKCIQCFLLDNSIDEVLKSVVKHIENKCNNEVDVCINK